MPGMLNLLLVSKLVVDGSNNTPAREHQFVHEWQESAPHVPLDAGHQVNSLATESIKQIL